MVPERSVISWLDMAMPIPGDSAQADWFSVVVALFRQLHGELRAEIEQRGEDALNWIPCPGANSIATIITHTLGSEAETLKTLAGEDEARDREAEFQVGHQDRASLTAQLDSAEILLDTLEPRLNDRAAVLLALPTLPSYELRYGATWLIGNLAHAREHMGHIRLTVQLYDSEMGRRG
jgi:hypothetical protein